MKLLASYGTSWARRYLGGLGYRVVPRNKVPGRPVGEPSTLPAGTEDLLRGDNPRLQELFQRYATLESPLAQHTMWGETYRSEDLDLARFRADNVYLWQLRSRSSPDAARRSARAQARIKYFLYGRYVRALDRHSLLDRLHEDGEFGCWTFSYETLPPLSRDLLDSINELYFLDREIGLFDREKVSVLDVGAGYGRLAHRTFEALPNLDRYYCIDAVPESTFLCEFYTQFRGCGSKVVTVPLDELADSLPVGEIDLAVNIHSFSETGREAIDAWLDELCRLQVRWLLIVPNDIDRLLSWESDGKRCDYAPLLDAHSYRLRRIEPTIRNEDLRELIDVNDHFLLYEHEGKFA